MSQDQAALAAEQAALGAMLQDPAITEQVLAILRDETDFALPTHRTVYRTVVRMRAAGAPCDAVTVASALSDAGELDKVGGGAFLHTLIAAVPVVETGPYYARRVVDQADQRRLQLHAGRLDQAARTADPEQRAALIAEVTRQLVEVQRPGAAAADLLAGLRTGTWLDVQNFPPLRYAVPGLIPEGFTLLIGPPKAGKSWAALGILLAVASGGYAFGHIAVGAPRRVLYLALEDGDRRMQDRCRQLLGDAPIPDLFCYLLTVPPNSVVNLVSQFLERYPDTALVIIDTLGRVMPAAQAGESAYQRDYRVGASIKRLADDRPGLAVVVLHHDRKATSDDFVDSVSGTHGLAGSADTIAVLARKRQSTDGLLKITGRDVQEAEYALCMRDAAWVLDGASLAQAADRARQREETETLSQTTTGVLEFVREQAHQSPDGVPAKVVAEKFGKDAYQYLRRQVDAGRLTQPRRGYYLPVSEASEVRSPELTNDSSDTPLEPLWEDS